MAGLVDSNYSVVARQRVATPRATRPDEVVAEVVRLARELMAAHPGIECRAVGVGVPGFVKGGRVFQAYNIGCDDYPFAEALRRRLRMSVVIENDCNLFALGIHRAEFDGLPQSMAGMFLGTGVGGGLILNGDLHRGVNGTGGEFGQLIVDRNGVKAPNSFRGSLESIASHVGLVRQFRRAVRNGSKTSLQMELGQSLRGLTADHMRAALKQKDRLTAQIIKNAAEAVGLGVAGIISGLAPERVVLGGGVMDALAGAMMPVIRKTVRANVLPGCMQGIRISRTRLRGDGAIIGAAAMAKESGRA